MPKNDVMFLIMTVATKNGSGSTTDYYGAAIRWRGHRRTGPAARIAPRVKHPQCQARPMTVPRIGNVIDAQNQLEAQIRGSDILAQRQEASHAS